MACHRGISQACRGHNSKTELGGCYPIFESFQFVLMILTPSKSVWHKTCFSKIDANSIKKNYGLSYY
jgi:hypothetical protein